MGRHDAHRLRGEPVVKPMGARSVQAQLRTVVVVLLLADMIFKPGA